MGIPIIAGYGSNNKCLESFVGVCPFCGKETTLKLYESSNNVNLYFIPVAKFNKHYYLVCHLCDRSLELTKEQKNDLLYKVERKQDQLLKSFAPQIGTNLSNNAPKPQSAKITNGIEVLSGAMVGKQFETIDGITLTIGKDKNHADILLDKSYNKVSRVHCTITFDREGNKYYVTDCSSNGTYIENGRSLTKNTRTAVKRGAVLKLADHNCRIKLL